MTLSEAKVYLRLTGTDQDAEITDLLAAAVLDMKDKGVKVSLFTIPDESIDRAIITFVKANFGYEDPVISEKLNASYESQVNRLCISTAYREPEATE
jgi:urate oxidase